MTRIRRCAAVVAVTMLLAGCHRGATSAHRKTSAQAASAYSNVGVTPSRGPTSTTTRRHTGSSRSPSAIGSGSSATQKASRTAASGHRFVYAIRGTQVGTNYGLGSDLAVTLADQPDGGFVATWTQSHDTGEGGAPPPETETVHKTPDGWVGSFLPGDSGMWGNWTYQPLPLLAPGRYEQRRSWSIDSVYQGDNGYGTHIRLHLVGTVRLSGQKAVTVAGQPCTAWVLHDDWRFVDDPRRDGTQDSGDFWWCPDLRVFVKAITDTESPSPYPGQSPFQHHTVTTIADLVEQPL
jgi:hypothetical protein